MPENNLPTTDKYKLEVNVGLPDISLSQYFREVISDGRISTPDDLTRMVKQLVGRNITVEFNGLGSFQHNAYADKIKLSDVGVSISSMLNVAPDNLPPNIPPELTNELSIHLAALHEAEHATQYSHEEKLQEENGYVFSIIRETMLSDTESTPLFERKAMREVDADLAIVETLQDMDLSHVAQFWQDMRASGAFVEHIFDFSGRAYEHDTSSILEYYASTGKVIDPGEFITEKANFVEKVRGEMGVFREKLLYIAGDYPDLLNNFDDEQYKQHDPYMLVRPQGIMHAVQTLLDDNQLEGIQKWEAENYMAAMKRLGYVADPNYDYEAQIRDVLENKIGLRTKDHIDFEQGRIDAQGNVSTPWEQIF